MNRDACKPILTYSTDPVANTITSVTLTTTGNVCTEKIPVTVPGSVTDIQSFETEQLGKFKFSVWVHSLVSMLTAMDRERPPYYLGPNDWFAHLVHPHQTNSILRIKVESSR
jgi:hypothetical protein